MTSLKEYNSAEHALQYLARADRIPYRAAGEAVVMELVPRSVRRILDLGAGDGRLLALLRLDRPGAHGVATDLSPTMLDAARTRFAGDAMVDVVAHDLDAPLSALGGAGAFDAVVSGFAIHHCSHRRKRALYAEVFALLAPGGVFYNLEHVASPTPELHEAFFAAMGCRWPMRISRTSCSTSRRRSRGCARSGSRRSIVSGSGGSWRCSVG
jgi:SAM-dependent methyltransferase